jgi:hypothetical protein
MSSRKVFFDQSFEDAVQQFGGYRALDELLNPIVDALQRNPYASKIVESDYVRCRYVTTTPFGDVPALCILFRIEAATLDMVIYDAEELQPY